jgi:hypothetical protein
MKLEDVLEVFPMLMLENYYGCCGLPYGKEYQTLLINDEPSKVLWNSKWSDFFLESFRGQMFLKNKVQWLDLASCLWPPSVGLSLAKTVQVHYDFMVKSYKPRLSSSSKIYWFLYYMGNDNGDVHNVLPFLGIKYSQSFYFIISFYFDFVNLFFKHNFLRGYIFSYALVSNINLCLQLIWIVVCRLCNIVCNFEKGKKILAIQFFIPR